MKAYTFLREDDSHYVMSKDGALASTLSYSATKTSKDKSWFLTPLNDNIHDFKAVSNCVIFDCLLPPYDENKGRECSFYDPIITLEDSKIIWLKRVDEDSSSLPYTIEYPGVRPITKKNR